MKHELGNRKFGFIDKNCKFIIPLTLDSDAYLEGFNQGLCQVRRAGKWGAYDKNGNLVIPCVYDQISVFSPKNKIAIVSKNGLYGVIDNKGVIQVPLKYSYIQFPKIKYQYIGFPQFPERELDWLIVNLNGNLGVIDIMGKFIIPPKREQPSFTENENNLISVNLGGKDAYFVDKKGKELFTSRYSSVGVFRNGLCPVCKNKKWGFIDTEGKEGFFIFDGYDDHYFSGESSNDRFFRVWLNRKGGFFDRNLMKVTSCNYSKINNYKDRKWKVEANGKYGFIDEFGQVLVPAKYDWIFKYNEKYNLACAVFNGRCGFIDNEGKEKIPFIYSYNNNTSNLPDENDFGYKIQEGMIVIKLNGKYGFIDMNGDIMISFKYNFANNFFQGKARVELDNKTFVIDKRGNTLSF